MGLLAGRANGSSFLWFSTKILSAALRAVTRSKKSRTGKVLACTVFALSVPRSLIRLWRALSATTADGCAASSRESAPLDALLRAAENSARRRRHAFNAFGLSVGLLLASATGALMWATGNKLAAGMCWAAAAGLLWVLWESVGLWGE